MSRAYHTRTRIPDRILVSDLYVQTTLGSSLWLRPDAEKRKQPISISIAVPLSLSSAGIADSLSDSVSYSTICKAVERTASQQSRFRCAEELAEELAEKCLAQFGSLREVNVRVKKLKGLLHASAASVDITRRRVAGEKDDGPDVLRVEDLRLSTIIGLNPWERLEKQVVHLNLTLSRPPWRKEEVQDGFDFRAFVNKVSDHVLESSYNTVESLAAAVAQVSLSYDPSVKEVTVRVSKPSALMFAAAAELEITRTRQDLAIESAFLSDLQEDESRHNAVIALGSNLGDRCGNIERALRELEAAGVRVVDTSFMYETDAMYVEDQPRFLNAACVLETSLDPGPLLSLLKKIETSVGRTKTFTNGPRIVDLDIIFYGGLSGLHLQPSVESEYELIVPHPRVQDREFVLRPLADILPDFVHPSLGLSIRTLLAGIAPPVSSMYRVLPFPPVASQPSHGSVVLRWPSRTYIMTILNSTPDSFSDGGVNFVSPSSVSFAEQSQSVLQRVQEAVASGADILDIGGYSTRPNAAEVPEEEEIARVVPIVQLLRANGITIPISVDTFRAEVVRQAFLAGANCVNDVYALTRDPQMLQTVKELGVPVVMMHSRGDAGQQKDYSQFGSVMDGVRTELGEKVARALRAGIRRWNIIADPGIGFSKTVEGNLSLLRDLPQFTGGSLEPGITRHPLDELPVLVGPSRKSFLGRLTGTAEPEDRLAGTAAACGAAVQGGAVILRVHDTKEMKDVAVVADGIWRQR